VAKDRADWLLDAIATATQDRKFLRGDEVYDPIIGEAILLNAEKAIFAALRALNRGPRETEGPEFDAAVERGLASEWKIHSNPRLIVRAILRAALSKKPRNSLKDIAQAYYDGEPKP
jgi:hypothetical protein